MLRSPGREGCWPTDSILWSSLKSQAPRSSFVNCRLGFPGNVYEATSLCCTFLVLIGSYGGEGSALGSLFEIRGVPKGNGPERCCGALSTLSEAWFFWEILSLSGKLSPTTTLAGKKVLPPFLGGAAITSSLTSSASAGKKVLPPFLGGAAITSLSPLSALARKMSYHPSLEGLPLRLWQHRLC